MKKICTAIYFVFLVIFNINAQNDITANNIKHELEKNKSLFSDKLFSLPSKKANQKKIDKIKSPLLQEAFTQILRGTYPYEYRVQEYRSYLDPKRLSERLKISAYSQFENPTGIFFSKGEDVVLILDDNFSEDGLQLRIINFGEEGGNSSYDLTSGVNTITPQNSGNGYIQYFTEDDSRKDNVKIHILGGQLNGYFDAQKHDNEDWKRLLSSASSDIIDIMGSRVQLAYDVKSLKEFCPENGTQLIGV